MNHPDQLTPAAAAEWLAQPDAPVVLDVRAPAEFAHGHLERAHNVPLPLVQEHADRIGQAVDGDLLLVCRTDGRANQAAVALAGALGPRVHVLTGGMSAWEREQLPVSAADGGPWAMERQVRTVAGALVLTGVLGSLRVPGAKWLSAGIGTGLLYSGLSNTCGMAAVLARMPWNRGLPQPQVDQVTAELSRN